MKMKVVSIVNKVVALIAAVLLGACSSPPKLAVPDGGARVPANDSQRLAEVKNTNAQQRSLQIENDALRIQVAALQRQMDDLRIAVAGVIATAKPPAPAAAPQPAQAQPVQPQPTQPSLQMPKPLEGLKLPKLMQSDKGPKQASNEAAVKETAMLKQPGQAEWRSLKVNSLTKLFSPGQTRFDAMTIQRCGLLPTALAAKLVIVHAATDSSLETPRSREEATMRGNSAVAALVASGVPRDRIKLEISSFGAFAVPNDSAEGRALNRRVDILFYDQLPNQVQA
jgi:hypothetical protein